MKRILIFATGLVLCSSATLAQPPALWTRTFGGVDYDCGFGVQQTADGGYIIVGTSSSFNPYWLYTLYLIKTDPLGVEQWHRLYGGTSNFDHGYGVEQTSDGGYIVTGIAGSTGAGMGDVWVLKTDAEGIAQWTRTWGQDYFEAGYSVQETADGGYIVAGYHSNYAGEFDALLLKYSASGDLLWTQLYGGIGQQEAYDVKQTLDGGYILTGYTEPYGGYSDVWLIKTDADGHMDWNHTYGHPNGDDVGYCVQQTQDGGYIITGSYAGYPPDVYLIKVDASGAEEWNHHAYGGGGEDVGHSVVQTPNGGYVVAGYTSYFTAGNEDVCLLRYDAAGTLEWYETFGGALRDYGLSLQRTTDGGYIITGRTQSYGAGYYDVYLIKTEPEPVSSVEHAAAGATPSVLELAAPRPNPLRSTTTLTFTLSRACPVRWDVFALDGRVAGPIGAAPVQGGTCWYAPGQHQVVLDGSSLPAGVYLARLSALGQSEAQRIIVLQ